MSSRPFKCYVSKAIEEDPLVGSHPEVKGQKPLKLCRCLVHIRSTFEHSIQKILDVVPVNYFIAPLKVPLTGMAETKICATMFQVCPPQKYFNRIPILFTPIYPDKSTGLLLNGTNGISLLYVLASPFLPLTSSPTPS